MSVRWAGTRSLVMKSTFLSLERITLYVDRTSVSAVELRSGGDTGGLNVLTMNIRS